MDTMAENEAVTGAPVTGVPAGAPVALPTPQSEPFPVATLHGDSNEPVVPEDAASGIEDDDPPSYSASVYPSTAYYPLPVASKGQAPVDYPAEMYPQEQMQPFLGAPSQYVEIVRVPPKRVPTDEAIHAIALSLFVTLCCCCCIGIPALVYAVKALKQSSVDQSNKYVATSIRMSKAGAVVGVIFIILRIILAITLDDTE